MPTKLYLDTARLGQMSPSAQLAHIDFARLAGEEAGSLHFDDFLRHGCDRWPQPVQRRYPALAAWRGVADLKRRLKRLAGAKESSWLLLANRSAQLVRLAGQLFFGPCRSVLITDLSWPSYTRILERQAKNSGNHITCVPLRQAIYHQRLTAAEVVDLVAEAFIARRCDGLFLPAVDNFGVRVPVEQLVTEIRRRSELRFVVIDGAQAFCHAPVSLTSGFCDLYIAGCHKWLRACYPMGLAFYGRRNSESYIDATLSRLIQAGEIDDPLLTFSEELDGGRPGPFGETVNLASLFSCSGAVEDALSNGEGLEATFKTRLANAVELSKLADGSGWRPFETQPELRSGIVLLQSREADTQTMPPELLRRRLLIAGVAATVYPRGRVRLSMLAEPWRSAELDLVISALRSFTKSIRDSCGIRREYFGEVRPA